MNLKPKGFCFGVVVICTIAIVTFHSGVCEPVDLTRPFEQGLKHDMQSVLTAAMLKARRRRLGSRLKLGNSNIHPQSMKPVDLGEISKSGMSSLGPDQYQSNPSDNFKTNCNNGEVKHITQGRFDFYPDNQAEERGDLQPVVSCAEASMTLTAPRRWAAQLQLGTGNDASFPLPKLPPQCGYSIHKSWRDISLSVKYNGCHVTQEGAHYVLPLLWRRTPAKIACPVSPIKPQALDELSLCCSSRGVTVRIRGPSAAKELNVNVRGEWTPLLELVLHCGYSMDRTNAETVITAPFLACGITSRDGNRELSLQIGEEVFALTCYQSTAEALQHQSLPPTTSAKPTPTYETPKPFQWARPFYLAPPHYPHPAHHHKTRVYGGTPLTPTTASFETPQKDEQQNKNIRPFEEYYREQVSQRGLAKVFPHLKHTPSLTHSPTEATGFSPTSMPHNYAFNPFYHFYHHPKMPPTNRPPVTGSVVILKQQSEVTEKMPMYHHNLAPNPSAPMPLNSFFHHYLTRTNFGDFQNPTHSTLTSPLPAFATQIHGGHIIETKDFAPVNPPVNHMHSSTNHHPPYGSPMNPNTPIYPYHHLPPDFYQLYHLYHGLQGENSPTPASFPQTPNSIPPSEDPKDGSGSHFQPELPVPFKPGNDRAEGLNNKGESAAHSDPSYDGSSWEKWFNLAAKVNYVPEPLYMLPPPGPVPEERTREEASVEGHIGASSAGQPFASPCCSGTGSRFHSSLSPRCFSFPVKDCISGEYFVFILPEFVVEPKVVGVGQAEESCALKRLTSDPHVYFVPLYGCGVTKEAIDAWMIYQLELETCDSDNSLRMLVECSSYPGLPSAETLHILDPLPLQYPAPLQLRIATEESYSYHPEAHLPLSRVRGRLVLMELGLLQPPDPSVALRVHYCLAYTLPPYASAMLIYDGCLSGSESQLLPSPSSNVQYIVVTSFLSLTSSPSIVHDADPEVYFFCLTEVCSASDGVRSGACIQSLE